MSIEQGWLTGTMDTHGHLIEPLSPHITPTIYYRRTFTRSQLVAITGSNRGRDISRDSVKCPPPVVFGGMPLVTGKVIQTTREPRTPPAITRLSSNTTEISAAD